MFNANVSEFHVRGTVDGGRKGSSFGWAGGTRMRMRVDARAPRGGRAAAFSSSRAFAMARSLVALAAVLLLIAGAAARKSAPVRPPVEPQIEEVTAKQLERVLEDKDFVAVYWCKCPSVARRPESAVRRLSLILYGSVASRAEATGHRPARGRPPPCRNVCCGARPNGLSSS